MTGILIKLVSTLSLTGMSALIRSLQGDIPVGEIVFCRNLFALIPLLAWLAWRGDLRTAIRSRRVVGHGVRGILGVASMFCTFAALSRITLPDNTAIGYASPIVVVILAAVVLHERVRFHRWMAVGVGLCGVFVILWPHLAGGQLAAAILGEGESARTAQGAILAFTGALLSAAALIQVRWLVSANETTGAIVFYFSLFSALTGLCTLPFGWVVPDFHAAATLLCIGLCGGLGQILLTACYRYADASLVASFEYSSMLWSLTIGWLAFGDLPTAYVLVGGSILIGAGVYVIVRERRLGLAPRVLPEAVPAVLQ